MTYGYARCSTDELKQDIDRQVRELRKYGADEIYLDYEHGTALVKKNLNTLFDIVLPEDTLVVLEVSRLSRSVKQLLDIIEFVKAKRLRLEVVGSFSIDCRKDGTIDPMTQAFCQMSAVFAELELSIIRQRVKSGMANAKAKGKQIGRKPTTKDDIPGVFFKHYPTFKNGKMNVSEFARITKLSRPSIYKYTKLVENG